MTGRHVWSRVRETLRAARDIYEGVFIAPYRAELYREYLRRRDQFFLIAFADLVGAPHPIGFYTLELYPHLIEEFHQWHRRLGLEQAPDGGFRCC